ncbi:pyridoxal kinase PdxY [Escherichia coli]|nr:pyridoxal kinase PdxY [Escherichia coli]
MKNILAIQSHVVYGHAGNSAAEFPMRRLGANVWPLNTVQFSNHTQYGKWTGCVMPPSHLTEIVQGIAAIDKLHTCDAVLSGYLGSAEQGEHILGIVRQVKAANPQAKYFCDPVMGHPEKGCIVAPGVAEFHVRHGLPASDIIAPNLVELEILCEHAVNNVEEAVLAARELIAQGPQIVLVKHLARAGYSRDRFEMLLVTADEAWHISRDRFEMLLVTADEAWHISRPLVDFGMRQPVGVGDVTSGLLLVKLLQGATLQEALEHVTAAVYEIMVTTKAMQEYELQVVAAQDRIAKPEHYFSATKL